MEKTSKEIFNKLVDCLKEGIRADIPKDIMIERIEKDSSKVETGKLKEVIELYFSVKDNIDTLKKAIDFNFDEGYQMNKDEALSTLESLRKQYNLTNTTKEKISIIQTDEESAEIEMHCTKNFFVSSVIGLINHGKDEGIINKADLDYIFNATK